MSTTRTTSDLFVKAIGLDPDKLSESALGAVETALRNGYASRSQRVADPYNSRNGVANKIEWEGGILDALDYGIHAEDMPDAELREMWALLEASFMVTNALADAVSKMLPEPGGNDEFGDE